MKRRKQSLICMRDLRSVDTSRLYFSPSLPARYLAYILEVSIGFGFRRFCGSAPMSVLNVIFVLLLDVNWLLVLVDSHVLGDIGAKGFLAL